jgi:hypothetical protein
MGRRKKSTVVPHAAISRPGRSTRERSNTTDEQFDKDGERQPIAFRRLEEGSTEARYLELADKFGFAYRSSVTRPVWISPDPPASSRSSATAIGRGSCASYVSGSRCLSLRSAFA